MSDPVYGWVCVGTSTCCTSVSSSGSGQTCADLSLVDLGGGVGAPSFENGASTPTTYDETWSFTLPGVTIHAGNTLVLGFAFLFKEAQALGAFETGISMQGATLAAVATWGGSAIAEEGSVTINGAGPTGVYGAADWLWTMGGTVFRASNPGAVDVTGDVKVTLRTFLETFPHDPSEFVPVALMAVEAVEVVGVAAVGGGAGGFHTLGNGPPAVSNDSGGLNPNSCNAAVAFLISSAGLSGSWANGFTGMGSENNADLQLDAAGYVFRPPPGSTQAVKEGVSGTWVLPFYVISVPS